MGAFQSYVSSLSPQPVLWFKLDEATSDNPIINSGTSANNFAGTGSYKKTTGGIDGGHWEYTPTTGVSLSDNTSIIPAYLNYTLSFWIRRNLPGVGTYSGQGPIAWNGGASQYQAVSGSTISIESDGKLHWYSRHGGTPHTELVSGDLRTDQWILITYTRNGSLVKLYQNGVLISSTNDAGTSSNAGLTGTWTFNHSGFGGTRLDEITLFNYTFTDQQVANLYNSAAPSTNINRSALPMTATALSVLPSISTTVGVSFGTTAATASAQISFLSVSGTANFEHSFAIATALMTEPTLSFTFNDHTEVVTSLIAGPAEFINPFFYGGQTNISNAADVMIASADKGTHNIIGGSGASYPADEATATALFQYPAFIGQGDRLISATVLTATALMTETTSTVNPSYFHEIRKINPKIYFNGTLTNYGSTPATIALDSNWTRQPDDAPLSYIFYDGNNNSYDYTGSSGGREQMVISGADLTTLLNTTHVNKSWTMEYWYKSNAAGTGSWSDGDSQPNWWLIFGNVRLQTFNSYIAGTVPETYPAGFTIKLEIDTNTGTYTATTGNLANVAPSFNWHHIAITQNGSAVRMYLNGGLVLSISAPGTVSTADVEPTIEFYPSTFEQPGYSSIDEIVYYDSALTQSVISDHYNYIKNFDPSKIFYAEEATAAAEMIDPNVISVANKNIPATPITASTLFVDPLVIASINISTSATVLTASANAVEPSFYGNPDASITEPSMIATADIPQNIYRLDTAYYTYVQTNIAPFRYVTFDFPNSNLDYGSDNDFGGAAPFTYGGSITASIDGINNNALLTDGSSYTTSGLIMKESEHDDDWATTAKTWHTSFWIKKDITDTNPNGLRIIANLHSHKDNKHLIVYQYNNYIYLQLDDKVNPVETFQSSVNANVFDGVKHHIVINATSNNKIHVYKNKILIIDASLTTHVITKNSDTYLAPNTETNNKPRFAIGALITPYAETSLSAIPTESIMQIDEAHWAVTTLNQTGVNNLYSAMPFKTDIQWFADPALSNFSQFVQPTFGTGAGINAAPAQISNAQLVNPSVSADFELIFNASSLQANANAVEPFSVIADNITNIVVSVQHFLAGAMLLPAVVRITVPGATMYASARIQYPYPYTDPYRMLILSQQYKQLTASGFVDDTWVWKNTFTVGDLN